MMWRRQRLEALEQFIVKHQKDYGDLHRTTEERDNIEREQAYSYSLQVPTKYNTAASSINGPSLSMPENVKSGMFSMPHPSAEALLGTSIATGPAHPQHLVHPYSQPTLPLGHFANIIGYLFLPQSYAYMPPAYKQAYAGNSTYHQTPQSASVPSDYGGFGSSINIPGDFLLNPSTTSASSTIGYDDIMNS